MGCGSVALSFNSQLCLDTDGARPHLQHSILQRAALPILGQHFSYILPEITGATHTRLTWLKGLKQVQLWLYACEL
jgi:hypothetical protein